MFHEVTFDSLRLPAWAFSAPQAHGTLVVFGGFDSYIEEFFPILLSFQDEGWNVVAFEGPGQGTVLEEQGAPLMPEWHRPVTAVRFSGLIRLGDSRPRELRR